MVKRLQNKNIIITAAGQGIGRATAIAFYQEGAKVIATDINFEKLKELKNENSKIDIQQLDATNKNAVESFAVSITDIDILFHAVGFVHHGTIMDCSSEEFYNSVNINVYSAYLMSSILLPKMLKYPDEKTARERLREAYDVYKYALRSMKKILRKDGRIAIVSPGIKT